MLLSSWLKKISDRIRSRRYHPDRKPKKPNRFTQLGLTRLEDRVVLTVSAAFDTGVLDLMLDAQDDVAEVTIGTSNEVLVNGSTVNGGNGTGGEVLATDVNRLTATDSSAGKDQTGQEVRLSDSLTLSDGLLIDNTIEIASLKSTISGAVTESIEVQSATIALGANLTTDRQDIVLGGSVTIGEGLNLTLSTGSAVGNIQIDGTLNGTVGGGVESLSLSAGTGNIILSAIGSAGSDDLELLTVTSAARTTITGAVDLDSSLTITSNSVTLQNSVTTGGTINVNAEAGSITLQGALDTSANATSIILSATLDIELDGANADVTTGGGAFLVISDSDSNGRGKFISDADSEVNTTGIPAGMVSITAADVRLNGTINAGTGTVVFAHSQAGDLITLGEPDISSTTLPSPIDLNDRDEDILLYGASADDNLSQESGIFTTDVNGDGIDDLIVGSKGGDGPTGSRSDSGEIYIYFGSISLGAATLDAAGTNGSAPDVIIYGATAGDKLGDRSGLAAGDVNGDGINDLIIGAHLADGPSNSRADAGEVYIIYGSSSLSGIFDLANGDEDVLIYGATTGDSLADNGELVTGDVNGDGIEDLIIGAHVADGPANSRGNAGEVYVIYGSASLSVTIDLANGDQNVIIYGATNGDEIAGGGSLTSADVNGDGRQDIIIGSQLADGPANGRSNAGEVYIIYGSDILSATIDLANGDEDVVVYGAIAGDQLTSGGGLTTGDLNGDGRQDVIISAQFADGPSGGRSNAGEVYVIYGSSSLPISVDLAANEENVRIYGATAGDVLTTGGTLTTGDLNGDGIQDLILGTAEADGPSDSRGGAGEVYVIFGGGILAVTIDLAAGDEDVLIYGAAINNSLSDNGALVTGDVNGDGTLDLIIGSTEASGPSGSRGSAGEAYVIYGGASLSGTIDLLNVDENVLIYGASAGDRLTQGGALATGDVNGDGGIDILLGAPNGDGPVPLRSDAGEVYVILGIEPKYSLTDSELDRITGSTLTIGNGSLGNVIVNEALSLATVTNFLVVSNTAIRVGQSISTAGSMTLTSTSIELGANLSTEASSIDLNGAITLFENVLIESTTNGSSAGANISLNAVTAETSSSAETLTIDAGTDGDVVIDGRIGANRLGLLTISEAGDISFTHSANPAQFSGLTITSASTFTAASQLNTTSADIDISADDAATTGTSVSLAGADLNGQNLTLTVASDVIISANVVSTGAGAGELVTIRGTTAGTTFQIGNDGIADNASVEISETSAAQIQGSIDALIIGDTTDQTGTITIDDSSDDDTLTLSTGLQLAQQDGAGGDIVVGSSITTGGDFIVNGSRTTFNIDGSMTIDTSATGGDVQINDTIVFVNEGDDLAIITGGGNVDLAGSVTANSITARGEDITITAGSGTVTLGRSGQSDTFGGSGTARLGNIDIVSSDDLTVHATVTAGQFRQQTGAISARSATFNAALNLNDGSAADDLSIDNVESVTFGSSVVVTDDISLTNVGEVDFGGGTDSIETSGGGTLLITPDQANRDINLGQTTDVGTTSLDLTDADLAAIKDGFSLITIGRSVDGTGVVDINSSIFRDNVTITGGSVSVTGLDVSANSVTLIARTGDITDG
ncbi:MAG: FG-GAP repeat protein, partial [Rhodopirellula sp.]|nr:FG-GAP repeat protein [Rhodopirellula sp.]